MTCVINNFQQLQPSPLPPRPHRPESVLGMPMVTLPCVESPLEKLSGPQVRGGGGCEAWLRSQKRGWRTHPLVSYLNLLSCFFPQKRANPQMCMFLKPPVPEWVQHLRFVLLVWNELWFYFSQRMEQILVWMERGTFLLLIAQCCTCPCYRGFRESLISLRWVSSSAEV